MLLAIDVNQQKYVHLDKSLTNTKINSLALCSFSHTPLEVSKIFKQGDSWHILTKQG